MNEGEVNEGGDFKEINYTFEQELTHLINRKCMENASNTPDFMLAQYLNACLEAFSTITQQRETFYGRDARPTFKMLDDYNKTSS